MSACRRFEQVASRSEQQPHFLHPGAATLCPQHDALTAQITMRLLQSVHAKPPPDTGPVPRNDRGRAMEQLTPLNGCPPYLVI
jgi:hypothetical protein